MPSQSERIDAVVKGEAQFTTLTPEEREIAHARIDAAIAARPAVTSFAPRELGSLDLDVPDEVFAPLSDDDLDAWQ